MQPARDAVGDLARQMADLLGRMGEGLALPDPPDPRRAGEWLEKTRDLRLEIQRVDDALAQAEESVRLNPKRLRFGNPAAGLRDGLNTLERAATDMRVLARSVVDSTWLDSEYSPVGEAETRARLAAVIAELSAAVRAYGQVIEAGPELPGPSGQPAEPPAMADLEDHLEEAQRRQDKLADLLQTDPTEHPEGWPLRGEILAHVDRLRTELEPAACRSRTAPDDRCGCRAPGSAPRRRLPRRREGRSAVGTRAGRSTLRARAGQTARRAGAGRRPGGPAPGRRPAGPGRAGRAARARPADRLAGPQDLLTSRYGSCGGPWSVRCKYQRQDRRVVHRASLATSRRPPRPAARSREHAGSAKSPKSGTTTAERMAASVSRDGQPLRMPVQVAQEDGVIAPQVVLGHLPGRVQHFHAVRHGRLVHGIDRGAVGRPEGHVQLAGLSPVGGPSQKTGWPSGPHRPTAMVSRYG